jgi:hypothetical protein
MPSSEINTLEAFATNLRFVLFATAISFSILGISASLHAIYTAAVNITGTDLPRANLC